MLKFTWGEAFIRSERCSPEWVFPHRAVSGSAANAHRPLGNEETSPLPDREQCSSETNALKGDTGAIGTPARMLPGGVVSG